MQREPLLVERLLVSSHSFRPHSHDEFVLSLNAQSVLREEVRLDRQRFVAGAGSVTAYNPHQVQSSTTKTVGGVPWECMSIYAPRSSVASLTGRNDLEFSSPVVDDARVAEGIRRAARSSGVESDEWATWAVGEALVVNGTVRGRAEPVTTLVDAARRLLAQELRAPASLDELSERLGASRDTIARAFVRETGVPPYAWHLQLRLHEGQRRLSRGSSVADVAADLGFTDQSHFHRHYRAAYARTPGQDVRPRAQNRTRRDPLER